MSHKLLLADDSVTIQRVIELTFADEDVQVIAVGDGRQAIERIETERPDIVLADVGMPERDGYEVAAFVKNTAHLAHIPVLLLTGAFEPIDEQRASAAGCDGVLAKPFEPHMVITRVKELLARASSAAPIPAYPAGEPPRGATPGPGGVTAPSAPSSSEADYARLPERGLPSDLAERQEPTGPAAADAAAEVLADPTLRLSRRTPIAVPGFGAPAPPPETLSALDEYFDRLDAQFATLQQGAAPGAPDSPGPEASTPLEAGPLAGGAAGTGGPAAEAEAVALQESQPPELPPAMEELLPEVAAETAPVPEVVEEAGVAMIGDAPHLPATGEEVHAAAPVEDAAPPGAVKDAAPAAAVAEAAPAAQSPEAPASSAAKAAGPAAPAPSIAQAFSALFAAERGETPEGPVPGFVGAPALPPAAIDDLVERVTRQVLERLSDRVVRDTVSDIVSRVSERLVREEIERVKATLK